MKKILVVLAMVVLAACNNSATGTEKAVDSSANVTVDSIKAAADSTTNLVDSTKR